MDNYTKMTCDADHIIHDRNSSDYPEIRAISVPIGQEHIYEVIPVSDIPPYPASLYKAKLVAMIRERYDQDDENGLLRQQNSKPEEFAEYNAYVEQCKAKVKEELTNT